MFSLNPGQIRQLLGAVDIHSAFGRRDYLLILFLYQTGLRVGECSHLITQMVYSQGKAREWLHLPAAVCKSSRGRVVPLNALARVCIEKQVYFNQQRGFSTAPAAPLFHIVPLDGRIVSMVRCLSGLSKSLSRGIERQRI